MYGSTSQIILLNARFGETLSPLFTATTDIIFIHRQADAQLCTGVNCSEFSGLCLAGKRI